jgi:tetratricopeptide (TPR) repeat protein
MKVFLSHSTIDKPFVEKLAPAMIANGFTPWLCEVDIEISANFVAEISKGLKESDLILLVWSPDAANSVWTQAEWTTTLKQEVEQSRIRLGVIMLRQHDLPPLLDTKNFIGARSDHDTAIRRTLEWLEVRRKAQRFSGLSAPIFLPYRPEDFVGRSVYLDQLRNALTWQPRTYLLHGEPGTGKSTLALQFAWDAQKDFDAVVFQTCGRRPLDAITAELVDRLPIDVKTLAPDRQRDAAKLWLRQRQSLLVLDDVWPNGDGKIEVTQLEPGPACSVLYTSRLKSLPGLTPRKQTSEVEKFTASEAEELFHTYLDPVFSREQVDKHRQPLLDFAARVEMLPIAVAVGASLLRDMSAMSLSKAVSKLKVGALADGEKNVNALFVQAIDSQPQREQKLLAACAVCVQEGFWLPLAAQIAELTEDEADDAANALVRGSLLRVLDRDRQRFQLHALLREQLRTRGGTDGLAGLQQRHAAALESFFQEWETRWRECLESLQEIVPAANFLGEGSEYNREPELAYNGFELARRTGEYNSAFHIAIAHETLWTQREHPDAKRNKGLSYRYQAIVLFLWGRLQDALNLYQKEEAIFRELEDKFRLLQSYGNQALILQNWGRLEDAMELLKKTEATAIELDERNSLQATYGNQALILTAWGRLEEAMAMHKKEEALAIELGNKDQLQRSYGNQALILIDQGQLVQALELLKKQESMCIELGNKSNLGSCYWIWADIEAAQGNRLGQKQKLQQALALFTELNMPRERDSVQAALDQLNSA